MSHTHFTTQQRYALEIYLNDGKPIADIASNMPQTENAINREIRRNAMTEEELQSCPLEKRPANPKHYSAELAILKAKLRRYNANQSHRRLISDDTPLAKYIISKIKKRWSPEQISGRLRTKGFVTHGVRQKLVIAVQTIYDWIYDKHQELKQFLRHNRGYKHTRQYYINKQKRIAEQMKRSISLRPEEVDKRSRIGHWEGDTVLGKSHGATGRIATFTERKSGFLQACKIDALTTEEKQLDEAEQEFRRITTSLKFADGCVEALRGSVVEKYLKTLTLDNGSENVNFEWIERGIAGMKVYFAHAYCSYERGTNENTNGLLRQYFPKGMDFQKITQEDIDKAVKEINNRPRKRLNWSTPKEVMQRNHALCDLR